MRKIGVTTSGKIVRSAYDNPAYDISNLNYRPAPARIRAAFPDYTKADHREAAKIHAAHRESQATAHGRLFRKSIKKYGRSHPPTSGGVDQKFPKDVNEKLRALAHGASNAETASVAHYRATGARTPYHKSTLSCGRVFVYSK